MIDWHRNTEDTMFGTETPELWVWVEMQTEDRLRIKISDDKPRFEVSDLAPGCHPTVAQVPLSIRGAGRRPDQPRYNVSFTGGPVWGLRVERAEGGLVLHSALPGLIVSDQFLQLPLRLPPGSALYGWGENEQDTLQHEPAWRTWGLYSRDSPPDGATNMYGVHPRLTLLDSEGRAAGILFLNSAAQELAITPAPGIVYRTIGGIIDMYIFLGPGPEEVVAQYTAAVGRPPLPPYWALGFHLCRWGYNTLEKMQAARARTREAAIPQDAQWGDIDIMERQLDFTVDADRFGGLAAWVEQEKEVGLRFITILDPCIRYSVST